MISLLIKAIKLLLQPKVAIFFILLIGLISYGQMLQMNFWQDDNAVVFKFTHINEDAGYLGKGVFGEGAYRYTITPYLPIFYIFGYQPQPYFTLALLFYLGSVIAVYFFFFQVFQDKLKASLGGLLYACGYIASDGFIRMFNSVLTSLSVILACLTIVLYLKFFRQKKLHWWLFAIFSYIATIETGYIRTHYLIIVLILLDLSFTIEFVMKKRNSIMQSLLFFVIRLTPFVLIFYNWFIVGGDSRSGQVKVLILSLLRGEFYKTYSFFATLGNVLLPNEVFFKLYASIGQISPRLLTEGKIIVFFALVTISLHLLIYKAQIVSRKKTVLTCLFSVIILFLSRLFFTNPSLIGGINERISLYAGIFLFLLSSSFLLLLPFKRIGLILFGWVIVNLAAYGAYIPIYAYPSDNRYLLHSFIPLIGLFVLWSFVFLDHTKKGLERYVLLIIVLVWGGINLYSSVVSGHNIIVHRAKPSKRFFSQLLNYYPKIEKGSALYFYVPNKPYAQEHFNVSFSVAQMPEETAIAWRYGIDRYDLYLVTDFTGLREVVEKHNIPINKIYSFIADPQSLIDTTQEMRQFLASGYIFEDNIQRHSLTEVLANSLTPKPIEVPLLDIPSITELELTLSLKADSLESLPVSFPVKMGAKNLLEADVKQSNSYLKFRDWLDYFYQHSSVSATTSWKKLEPRYLLDKDPNTYWEADRVEWDNHRQGFIVDLGKTIDIGGINLTKGPDSLTPTEAEVWLAEDLGTFTRVKQFKISSWENAKVQKITFPHARARFVKLIFTKTRYDDAPGISEVLIIPNDFIDIDIDKANTFFQHPFSMIQNEDQWNYLMANIKKGLIKLEWQTDETDDFQSSVRSTFSIDYDSRVHEKVITLPPSGQKLVRLRITPLSIPGTVSLSKVKIRVPPLKK